MTSRRWLCLLGLFGLLAACAQHQPQMRSFQAEGVSFRYDARFYSAGTYAKEKRLTSQENGTDVPVDVFPARITFRIQNRMAGKSGPQPSQPADSSLTVIPLQDATVPDFRAAYPNLDLQAKKLKAVLARRPVLPSEKETPDPALVDQAHSLFCRPHFLDFSSGSGILFLTQYTQETPANPANNEELLCVFQGLTRDGRYYVWAQFAVTHPWLPKDIRAAQSIHRDPQGNYLRKVEQGLAVFPDDSFKPDLRAVKALLASLTIQAR